VYEYIEGRVAEQGPARLILDVGGIGYEIVVPFGSPFPAEGRARAWTHLVVREDAHLLIGFPERETRDLFRLLLSVRGVGATMALSLLSGLPREPLVEAIAAGDVATLTGVRGVGRKTAEQILLDLREKVASLRAGAGRSSPARAASPLLEDAVQALLSIGFTEKEARKSVEKAVAKGEAPDLEALLRAALSS
jgi:Holliday junction DNA helicase RuvA